MSKFKILKNLTFWVRGNVLLNNFACPPDNIDYIFSDLKLRHQADWQSLELQECTVLHLKNVFLKNTILLEYVKALWFSYIQSTHILLNKMILVRPQYICKCRVRAKKIENRADVIYGWYLIHSMHFHIFFWWTLMDTCQKPIIALKIQPRKQLYNINEYHIVEIVNTTNYKLIL